MEKNKVCIDPCGDYDYKTVKAIIEKHIDALGGMDALLSRGNKVVVKPNMVMAKDPSFAATTHPSLVKAVCEIFVKAGATVTVAESSGGLYNKAVMAMTYKTCGIDEAVKGTGAVISEDMSSVQVQCEKGVKCRSFSVITPIANADLIVNVCKLKTHTLTAHSGAVKNMFGVIPGVQKVEMHSLFPDVDDFCDMIVDLNLSLAPSLNICDAVDVMEGNGPTSGTKTHIGAILSSLSPFALDVVGASLSGMEPSSLPMIRAAERRGIMEGRLSAIELVGENVERVSLKRPDTVDGRFAMLSTAFGGRLRRWLTSKPKINKKRCKGCGDCVRNCPQKLIVIKKGKAHIDHNGCIRCFCCHELCKFHAVDIKRPFISKI